VVVISLPHRVARREVCPLGAVALAWLLLASCTGRIASDGEPGAPDDPRPGGGKPAAGIPGSTGGAGAPAAATSLGEAALRRLTSRQYRHAIEDLLGAQAAAALTVTLEGDARLNGLTAIGATFTALSPRAGELQEQAADQVVAAALADNARRAALIGCDPGQGGCLETFLARFGRRAWRRPLSAEETQRLAALARQPATRGDAWTGLRSAISAILQSPHFLYRVELGQPTSDGRRQLDPFELASRLSFLLVDRAPDDALLDAAGTGRLAQPAELETQARRLLASPSAAQAMESFYADYLDLDRLLGLEKSDPAFTDTLRAAMRAETVQTLRAATFDQGRDLRASFTSRETFVTPELARLYGLPVPTGSSPATYTGPRAGLLMHAGLLALYAHETRTSPTRRGKFVRETVLCQSIPDPPANVDVNLPAPAPGGTTRARLADHSRDPACASCHALMDPLGLALENFDLIGRYRSDEAGVPIDASGALDGVTFRGPEGLAQAVAQHPALPGCFAVTLLRQASGNLLATAGEEALATALERSFAAAGFDVRALLLALVTHPAFPFVRPSPGS
jgi:hypothetical protein